MNDKVYAEDVNYWQTGQSSAAKWIERAKREIRLAGGIVQGDAFANEEMTGRAAYSIQFTLPAEPGKGQQPFRILWPVLQPRKGSQASARIQAATALYHEVKAACVKAKFLGLRTAFLAYLVLPSGYTAGQASDQDLIRALPRLLGPGGES